LARGGAIVQGILQQLALGGDGRIYSQADGHLFVVGKR